MAGLGTSFMPSVLSACGEDLSIGQRFDVNFDGSVLVVGAGAAGLTAAHLLRQHGIDFQLLEASATPGGRVKANYGFADFPIDLGAEWIHTEPTILAEILNDPEADANIEFIKYSPKEISIWKDGKLRKRNVFSNFYSEYKFKRTTWFDFFNDFILPGIEDRIRYNEVIATVEYGGSEVVATTVNGTTYTADRLVLTVPLTVLKRGQIQFDPPLPNSKVNAFDTVDMPDGLKVFLRMSDRFYPDMLFDGGVISNLINVDDGEKTIYDAAFRKGSRDHVLALFAVGEPATRYTSRGSEPEVLAELMDELDMIFDGAASRYYQDHVIQNWSAEPFIEGSYSHYRSYGRRDALRASVDDRLYFAGETYAPSDGIIATVHGAALSAFDAVEELVGLG